MKTITTLKITATAVALSYLFALSWPVTVRKFDYFVSSGRYLHAAIYLMILALCWIALALTPFIRPWFIRMFLLLFFFSGFMLDRVIFAMSNRPLTIELAGTFFENIEMGPGMVEANLGLIAGLAAIPLVVLALLCLPSKRPWSISVWFAAIPVGTVILITAVVHLTRGGATEFTSPFSVPAKFYTASAMGLYNGERSPVSYNGALVPKTRHIVLIVDESIRGDAIGLNNATYPNTPFLTEHQQQIANFGVATSSWNCSKESRLILRTGMRPNQLPDEKETSLTQPTIWQFANHAGYRTISIDGWGSKGRFHSFMNKNEALQVNSRLFPKRSPAYRRDMRAIDILKTTLSSSKPTFVFLNKYGAHFPYYRMHQSDVAPFDTGPNKKPGTSSQRKYLINSYNNAINWTVDRFFEKLFKEVPLDNTIIIYTSDHGQSLFEAGRKLTHCSKNNVLVGEGLVPLFAIGGNSELMQRFQSSAKRTKNRMSHFQIFPTLLYLLGYDQNWAEKKYGAGLLSESSKHQRFMTGDMFSRIRGAQWVDVDGKTN